MLNKLDAYIDIYLRAAQLDNARSSAEERERANAILIEREKALGLTGDKLDKLLEVIDRYAEGDAEHSEIVSTYKRL